MSYCLPGRGPGRGCLHFPMFTQIRGAFGEQSLARKTRLHKALKSSFHGAPAECCPNLTPVRNVYEDILVPWMVRIYKARLYSKPGSPDFYSPALFRHSSQPLPFRRR
jgi:hypothetical protein